MASEYEEKYTEQEWISVLQDRLAAYEDTGLMPEAFQSYVVFLQDLIGDQKASEALDRFRQLVKADKEGRAVVHTRWAHLGGDEWCCPVCGFVITTEGSWDKPTKKYCEDCGAKMDGGADHEAD